MTSSAHELPPEYSFTDQTSITPREIIDLRYAGDWGTERDEAVWESVLEQSIAAVGVRNQEDTLVGIGFLAGNARHAVLCDFIVHPEHRRKGIGGAILSRRIAIAEESDIPYLYTELAATNELKDRYTQLGFVATGNAYTRMARRHPSELEDPDSKN